MKKTVILLSLLVAALFLVPNGLAQQVGQPNVGGCKTSDEKGTDCNPVKENDGIKMGADVSVRTILYGHFPDILQRAPINTQKPDPAYEGDLNGGFPMPTLDTNSACAQCNVHFKNNRFIMFSSPGLVEYGGEGWRIHQEPGLARDVEIDGSTITGYWYMSTRSAPAFVPVPNSPGVMPLVGVYMRMETGRHPFHGTLIAEGDTGTGRGSPDAGKAQNKAVTIYQAPDGSDNIYQFKVDMTVRTNKIPSRADAQGYVVTIIPYQLRYGEEGAATSAEFTQADWRVRTGPDYPPRLVLNVKNPMVTTHTLVHTFDNHLFFRWSFLSPWGSYDLDANSLQLEVSSPNKKLGTSGPSALQSKEGLEFIKLKHSVDHDGHFKPLNATWRYAYGQKPLPAGEYTVSAMVHNLQNTYMLMWEEKFIVNEKGIPQVQSIGGSGGVGGGKAAGGGGPGGDSPGFEAFGLIVAAAVAAIVVARRRKDN
jgi:hypothetical protein